MKAIIVVILVTLSGCTCSAKTCLEMCGDGGVKMFDQWTCTCK